MVQLSDLNFPNEARAILEQFASDGSPIVVSHDDKEVGVLVTMREFELLQRLEDHLDAEDARQSMAEPGDVIDWDDLVSELGL